MIYMLTQNLNITPPPTSMSTGHRFTPQSLPHCALLMGTPIAGRES